MTGYDFVCLSSAVKEMGFEVGSRVKVIKQKSYKSVDLIGECGTVRDVSGYSWYVKLYF